MDPFEYRRLMSEAAQPQRDRGGLVRYNPTQQQETVRRRVQQQDIQAGEPAWKANMRAATGATGGTDDGGLGGVFGKLLNNPIGDTVLKGLGTLDVPRRVILSGINEAADAVNGGDASLSEFFDQVGDESFGFGDVVGDTGNKWLDRAVGFAGDVAFDPLTYLTFGAGKFAGQAGRIAASTKLADAGMDASKVARLGVLGASGPERAAIFKGMKNAESLSQPGLRFMGKRIGKTEGLAEASGRSLAKARAAIGDTRIGQGARNMRAPEGLEAAYRSLARGDGNANEALGLIAGAQTRGAESGMFAAKYANEADRLVHDIEKTSDGKRIFKALDEGEDLANIPMAPQMREFFDKVFDDGSQVVTAWKKRQDYAPHHFTDDFRKATRGDEWSEVRSQIGVDPTEATGGVLQRSIHPGGKITLPDGTVVKFVADTKHGAVSARQINDKLGGALGGIKVVEDDITKVLKPYVEGIAESVGRAHGVNRTAQIADTALLDEIVDPKASKKAGKQRADRVDTVIDSNVAADDAVRGGLREAGDDIRGQVQGGLEARLADAIAQLDNSVASASQADNALKGLADQHTRVTDEAASRVSAAQSGMADLQGEQRVLHESIYGGNNPGATKAKANSKATRQAQTSIDERRAALLGEMDAAEREAAKQYDAIDQAKHAARKEKTYAERDAKFLRTERDMLRKKLEKAKRMNVKADSGSVKAFEKIEADLDDVFKAVGKYEGSEQTAALMSEYADGIAALREGADLNKALRQMQKTVKKPEFVPVMKEVIRDGYERIGQSLLGDDAPMVRHELARQLKNLETALDDPNAFFRVVDGYTRFFKTYATATLGFHVRNGMSAAFMNATDGVTTQNMSRGMKLWQKIDKNPQTWMDDLPEWITPEQAEDAMRAVFASGGGQGQFGKAELRLGGSKLTNNTFTKASQRLGGKVEGFARMGMAVDTILAGGAWEEAAARITRIHFDYSAVSKLDRTMKRIIPFWTFMSRNVPLQLQQMMLKPRAYQHFKSLQRNMGEDYEGGMIPLSWQERQAFSITDGVYAAPDLPHVRLEDELNKLLTDPQRLLADSNPALKVPFETVIAGKKLFTDQEFQDNGFTELTGALSVLEPILSAAGKTETAGDGSTVADERLVYALLNLLPPLNQAQRLLPGNDSYYSDKRVQSAASNVGLPLFMLTDGQRKREQKRREREGSFDPDVARERALAEFRSR